MGASVNSTLMSVICTGLMVVILCVESHLQKKKDRLSEDYLKNLNKNNSVLCFKTEFLFVPEHIKIRGCGRPSTVHSVSPLFITSLR